MWRLLPLVLLLTACQAASVDRTQSLRLSTNTTAGLAVWFQYNNPLVFTVTEDGQSYHHRFCEFQQCRVDRIAALTYCRNRYNKDCYVVAEYGKKTWDGDLVSPPVTDRTYLAVLRIPTGSGNRYLFHSGYLKANADGDIRESFEMQGRDCEIKMNVHADTWKVLCSAGSMIRGTMDALTEDVILAIGRDDDGKPYRGYLISPAYLKQRGVTFRE